METYYNQLHNTINQIKANIDKLYLEKNALIQSKRAWSKSNYQKEEERIENAIKRYTDELHKNQELLTTYNMTKNYNSDVKELIDLFNKEKDPKIREELSKTIQFKKEFINNVLLKKLPIEITKNLIKDSTINYTDSKLNSLEQERNNINTALLKAKNKVKKEIASLNDIFKEERFNMEKYGPFKTEEALDNFINKYMQKKIASNKRIETLKKDEALLQRKLNTLDKKLNDRLKILSEANQVNLTPKEYENIINKINKRDELIKLFKKLGLNELIEKRDKALSHYKENFLKQKEIVKNKLVKEKQKDKELKALNSNKKATKEIIDDYIAKNSANINKGKVADYSYKTIINNLVKDLRIKKKDGKRFIASNIKVKDSFIKELSSGNYLYNIVHVVPAIIKVPVQLIRKLSTKITYKEKSKKNAEIIKERLDKLPKKDLMILFKEYGNHIANERYGTLLNTLVNEKITTFVSDEVNTINKDLENKYNDIFNCVKELDAINQILADKKITPQKRESYLNYKNKLIKGKAKEVLSVREKYQEAKTLLASGLHGFNENVKATESKMSYIGKRFAKTHDLDVELLEKEAKIERAERKAINDGNDEMALRCFVAAETLLSKNTKIEKSVFGKRSTGKKYYSPLAEKLDYQNDPFLRDIFTTVAVVGAAVSTINSLHTKDVQKQIDEANANNEKVIKNVNDAGEVIANKKGAFKEGMKAQNYQDSLNVSNVLERKALDQSSEVHGGWSVGTSTYYNARSAAQSTYNNFYETTKNAIENVTNKYASGEINQLQAMNLLSDISKNSQTTLKAVVNESIPHLANYARDHSQFDLTGIQDAMNYIVTNPDAITNMNKAMIESVELGEELANLSNQIQVLNSLPNNISTPLLTVASASALAYNVNNTVVKSKRNGKYGNKVTNLVDDYINSQQVLEEKIAKTR